MSNRPKTILAIIGTLVVFGTASHGCQSPENTSKVHEQRIQNLRTTWNRGVDQEQTLKDLATACESALALAARDRSLDILLGDILSNPLLRPDLGLPLYDAHKVSLSRTEKDGYWSALLRAQKVEALASEMRKHVQPDIPVAHPVSGLLAHHAKSHRTVTWERWLNDLNGIVLFETAPVIGRRSVQRPAPSWASLFETMRLLLPNWSLQIAIVESRNQTDPDPWTTLGPTPASGGKRQLLSYSDFGTTDMPTSDFWPQTSSSRRFTIVFEWTSPTGRRLLDCVDGSSASEASTLTTACSDRFQYFLDAEELLASGVTPDTAAFQPLIVPPLEP